MRLQMLLPLLLVCLFLKLRDLEAQLFVDFHLLGRVPIDHRLPHLIDVLRLNTKHLAFIVQQQPPEPVA